MKAFTYDRADSVVRAAAASAQAWSEGHCWRDQLLDLMKLQVETPTQLIDINRLPFDKIEETPTAACVSAQRCETAILRPTGACASAMAS